MLRTDYGPFQKRAVGGAKIANATFFFCLNITNTMKFEKYFPESHLSEALGAGLIEFQQVAAAIAPNLGFSLLL